MEIQKNHRIKSLINHLERKFGSDSFVIKDFWGSDGEAIGFSNPEESRLLYVSAYEGQTEYYVALEQGNINTSEYTPVSEHNDIQLNELEQIFSEYLKIGATK